MLQFFGAATMILAAIWLGALVISDPNSARGRRIQRYLVAVMVTFFAATAVWMLVGPGDRSGNVLNQSDEVVGRTSSGTGRAIVAPGAIVIVGLASYLWWTILKKRR
jgi:hypothetical protein